MSSVTQMLGATVDQVLGQLQAYTEKTAEEIFNASLLSTGVVEETEPEKIASAENIDEKKTEPTVSPDADNVVTGVAPDESGETKVAELDKEAAFYKEMGKEMAVSFFGEFVKQANAFIVSSSEEQGAQEAAQDSTEKTAQDGTVDAQSADGVKIEEPVTNNGVSSEKVANADINNIVADRLLSKYLGGK